MKRLGLLLLLFTWTFSYSITYNSDVLTQICSEIEKNHQRFVIVGYLEKYFVRTFSEDKFHIYSYIQVGDSITIQSEFTDSLLLKLFVTDVNYYNFFPNNNTLYVIDSLSTFQSEPSILEKNQKFFMYDKQCVNSNNSICYCFRGVKIIDSNYCFVFSPQSDFLTYHKYYFLNSNGNFVFIRSEYVSYVR